MKIQTKLFILTLLIILISGTSIINATQLQSNDTTITKDHTQYQSNNPIINNNDIQTSNDETSKKINKQTTKSQKETTESVENYSQLYEKLQSTNDDNVTISLNGDQRYEITNTITLKDTIKKLTIEGNGRIIDGKNQHQFLIINNPCNIMLNNLTITNCYSETGRGGSIYQENGFLTLNNSIISNNSVNKEIYTTYGNAIFLNNTNLVIDNTCFTLNGLPNEDSELPDTSIATLGGAIYFEGTHKNIRITNSNFIQNGNKLLTGSGGALNIQSNASTNIYNTTFTDNRAYEGSGIYYLGLENSSLNIDNSTFDKNGYEAYSELEYGEYTTQGGAINAENLGNIIINNSKFTSNNAYDGGVLVYYGYENSTFYINNNNFTNNGYNPEKGLYANSGGALYLRDNGLIRITNNNFTSNKVKGWGGGAIDYGGWQNSSLEINNNILDLNGNNKTGYMTGGALDLDTLGNVSILNSNFTKNNGYDASAIYYNNNHATNTSLTLDNCIFESNGQREVDDSNVVKIISPLNTRITNSKFNNNNGSRAALMIYGDYDQTNVLIENTIFNSNEANQYSGALELFASDDDVYTIKNSTFTNNSGNQYGAVYYKGKSELNIINSTFESNGKVDYNIENNGGAIFINTTGNTSITGSIFKNNMADEGVLYFYGYEEGIITITNTTFEENKAGFGAAFIKTSGNSSINECKFISNIAENGNGLYYTNQGKGELIIRNTLFDSNGNIYYDCEIGGAAYIETNSTVLIDNSTFNKNYAESGSAIDFMGYNNSNLTINNSIFTDNNNALELDTYGSVTITDSKFLDNKDEYSGAVTIFNQDDEDISVIIKNTLFDSNGMKFNYKITGEGGALYIYAPGNVTILNTSFTNNIGQSGGAINIGLANVSIINSTFDNNGVDSTWDNVLGGAIFLDNAVLNIINSQFTNNFANEGGVFYLTNSNVTILYTDFINNTVSSLQSPEKIFNGLVISSVNTALTLNHTNFIENGIPHNISRADLGEEVYVENGIISFKGSGTENLTIDNTNFTKNHGTTNGGIISYTNGKEIWYEDEETGNYYYEFIDNATFIMNHTLFKDNRLVFMGEENEIEYQGYILYIRGNTRIDNSEFYYNKLDLLLDNPQYMDIDEITGPIFFNRKKNITFNITNCVFAENNPANFIVNNSQVILNTTPEDLMIDGYIPNIGSVMVYTDEKSEAKEYQLKTEYLTDEYDNILIDKIYVDGLIISNDHYVYKLVINQTTGSQFYDTQEFKNNTYILRIPHDYTISVNATSPILIEDNTTISGKVYYTDNEGREVVFAEKQVDLYINNDFIDTTLTNEHGEYIFNYTGETIGTHNVLVMFNSSIYLPILSNTTTFNVTIRESLLNITAIPTQVGETTNITFKLTDNKGNPIPSANITFYIDNQEVNITTNNNGIYIYEYENSKAGDNYILAFFEGDYKHNKTINSTVFHVDKINTTITVQSRNCTLGDTIIITGKLTDKNNKAIRDTIILFIDEEEIFLNTTSTGEFTYNYKTIHTKENYIEIFYEGNDTYKDSINHTTFYVDKINTTTSANIISQQHKNVTFNVNIKGDDNKKINNGTVLVIDEKGEIIGAHNIADTTTVIITNLDSGTHILNITYEGNDIYNPSTTTKQIKIKSESNITIEVLNDTTGNVQIEITVNDEKIKPLANQKVIVTLPDGTTTTMTTDKNGKIIVEDTTTQPGNSKITVNVPDSDDIIGSNKTVPINIKPDYQKIIEDMNKTINTHNKTSKITAIPTNATVGDNKVIVTLENKLGNPITNAPITVKNNEGEIIGNSTTDNNGVAVIPVNTRAGTEKITITYPGDKNYTPSSTTISTTTHKNKITVTVDPVNGIIGENIILTAHITDTNGNPVSGGNLVFKLNGKTLRTDGSFNSTAQAMKLSVKNGIVTITIKADIYLRNIKNLTASYSGTYKYEESKSSTVTAQIKKRNAKITVTTTPKTQKQYNKITFTAKLTDTTPKYQNKKAINTGTNAIFKVNGKTIKDKKGNNLLVKVVNGSAKYKYTVPAGMGGISKDGSVRDYTVEAVLVSDTYYPDTRATTTFNVQRSPTTIKISTLTLKNNKLNIKAKIQDYKNKQVIGNSTVAIKINGKTYINPTTKKSQTFKVTNGIIDLKNLSLSKGITVKKVMIVTGARQAYLGARNETSKIVKV